MNRSDKYNVARQQQGLGVAPAIVVAAPYIAAGISTVGGLIWGSINKRGQRKVATTEIVNQYEPLLIQNLEAWNASNKYVSEQAYALRNFDAAWNAVKTQCEAPSMGTPGRWCVDDRKRGGKFDWFARYRDPIADDLSVQADPTITETVQSTIDEYIPDINVGGFPIGALLGVGLLGLALIGSSKR